ncbi:MAG TPA: NIPSNAP family protein, partial [Puia sp.]|nr:NIPSNAP family protein [Puia sp.]
PTAAATSPTAGRQEYFAIRIYQLKTALQESRVDSFLQTALLPALHRQHISGIGVFKPIGNDTAAVRRIYVFMPIKDLDQFASLADQLAKDAQYLADGRSYLTAGYDDPPYVRIESILLKAFPDMPHHAAPWAGQPYSSDRIYELRSYEGPTESYFANKVKMFNDGGEITLFGKLGFHAVFYASVLSGTHMPNLMYMTSFDNMAARDDHWKTFGADPTWKSLSSSPQYQHNVSHIDDIFLHAAPYSEL